MKKILIGSFAVIVLFVSCTKTNDSQNNCDNSYDACALKAPAGETAAVKAYLDTTNNIGDTVLHCSGMYYTIDSAGTGQQVNTCSTVYVNYTGMLTDSTVFQSTTAPVAFPVSYLIAGFKNILPLLKEGGVAHLYIPPSLAYGNQAQGTQGQSGYIPPNSILIFKVSVVAVQ